MDTDKLTPRDSKIVISRYMPRDIKAGPGYQIAAARGSIYYLRFMPDHERFIRTI